MKKITLLLFLFCVISVSAHEFWLQPDKFIYKKGETVNIKFRAGENFQGENWNSNRSKINFLSLYSHTGKTGLASLISANNGDSLQLTLREEGTAMVVYSGLNSYIELEAAKFNAYLEEDGLKDAIEYRKQHNETDSIGREYYQRSVKTILQVGNTFNSVSRLTTDLPLDIIPLNNPHNMQANMLFMCRLLFDKKALTNQLVKVWRRENGKTIKEELLTDQHGLIRFKIKKFGTWMVSTVKMIRLENDSRAQWQSYWASCTWGYE
jgi:uncharacterized GH25 family protein